LLIGNTLKIDLMKKIILSFFPLVFAGYSFIDNNTPKPGSKQMAEKQYDGPYVLYSNDKIYVKYIFEDNGLRAGRTDSFPLSNKAGISLTVATDEPGKTFSVQLKNKLQVEKSEYKKPNKLVAISDIEGNFAAFRELLQNCGVIDANYNWTFGDGNLVLVGDFFDRGEQVTEVLWLVYSLEDKAKAAGGYVHFILGNHEIMNLSGDIRYLPAKYIQDAELLGENYTNGLYGKNSEIGRWLRTKNVMEKIGDILFQHGGISSEMNRLDISSINRINDMARPYYPDSTYNYNDPRLDLIYSDKGPFWYRGYYKGNPVAATTQIDSTLEKFNVKIVTTGHTIIADTISVLHNGKLIDLDVHHAEGHSEALLIEGGKYYRVTKQGKKFLLME
jgi:hypothetical protein